MAQRPSRPLAWAFGAASGDVVEPPSGLAEAGWQPDQTVPAPYLNFLLSLTGQWVEFLRGPNLGTWTRSAWATSHTYDSPTRLAFAVDKTTPNGAAACYRFACVGEETGPTTTLTVSQTGETWARRTNIPSGLEGPFVIHTDGTRWMLAGTAGGGGYQLSTTVVDDGTGAGAIGSGSGSWATASFDDTVSEPKAIASSGGRSVLWTASEAFYSDDHGQNWTSYVLSGTARSGDGRDVVFDGVKWVAITQSGQIYASTDGVTFTYKSTLGASAAWQLAAGEAGEVVAYRLGSSSTLDFYRSTNSGSSWSAVTPSGTSLPKYLTSLRYSGGAWLATSSAAPWLWTSTDLVAWLGLRTPAVPSTSSTLFALVFEGGRWTALGNGYALTSGVAADAMPGAYVPGSLPAYLSDAGYLRGFEVSDATPADGEVLTWSDSLHQWIPAAAGGGGGIASRRLAATSDTRLLYECNGSSGVLANTGSLGSAGDLTAGGSCVRNALSARSTIGRGILGNGSASGGATGATGIAITGTALTAVVTFVVSSWPGGSVPVLARNAGPTWSPPYLGFRLSLGSGGVIQAEIELAGGAHPSPYASGYSAGMHQAVATYDGARFRLYVDGALAASTAATAAIAMGSGGDWGIAAQGDGGGLDGYVLRAQVDAVAWSADRVAEEWLRTLGDY